ncbi:MAG: polysaccharide deacetylase family protein [candidate division WOR-3 bacterium]
MKKFFIIFLFFCFFLLTCGSSNEVPTQPEPDTTQPDTTQPAPKKLCALTFDDGPDLVKTALVLDKLEKHNVVATFFVIGNKVNKNTKSVLERAVLRGCEIANHSFEHATMTSWKPKQIKESVQKTNDSVYKYAKVLPKFFRPPNLAVNNTMFEAIDLPFAEGILGYDWAACNTTASERADSILKYIRDGAIILLHDFQPDPHPTPEALDILIPALKDLGYEFVTLSDLFSRKGINPFVEYKMWKYVE